MEITILKIFLKRFKRYFIISIFLYLFILVLAFAREGGSDGGDGGKMSGGGEGDEGVIRSSKNKVSTYASCSCSMSPLSWILTTLLCALLM